MVFFSTCKINLGLFITGKRSDGYHNLETVFYPVPLYEAIEFLEAEKTTLQIRGRSIPGDPETNLVIKAWHLLKKDFPQLPYLSFYLLKQIPTGAGLGAGSANGAIALRGINSYFNLGLNLEALMAYALQLGSDCPFFIQDLPCLARGRGEILSPISCALAGYHLVLVHPGIHVSTAEAFGNIKPGTPKIPLAEMIKKPVSQWRWELRNDFEYLISIQYSAIASIRESLYAAGAEYSAMSGSGSTVFGLFKKPIKIPDFPSHYFTKQVPL